MVPGVRIGSGAWGMRTRVILEEPREREARVLWKKVEAERLRVRVRRSGGLMLLLGDERRV